MAALSSDDLKFINNADLAFEKIQQAKKLLAEARKLLQVNIAKPKALAADTTGLSLAAKKVLAAVETGASAAPELRAQTKLSPVKTKAALNELRKRNLVGLTGHGRAARWTASRPTPAAKNVEAMLSATSR